jgi:hypothetical protein
MLSAFVGAIIIVGSYHFTVKKSILPVKLSRKYRHHDKLLTRSFKGFSTAC